MRALLTLLACDADVNAGDCQSHTALARAPSVRVLRLLLGAGAEVEDADELGAYASVGVARALLLHGAPLAAAAAHTPAVRAEIARHAASPARYRLAHSALLPAALGLAALDLPVLLVCAVADCAVWANDVRHAEMAPPAAWATAAFVRAHARRATAAAAAAAATATAAQSQSQKLNGHDKSKNDKSKNDNESAKRKSRKK